jgi:drug/metabolite transporter (DMT)-like permease
VPARSSSAALLWVTFLALAFIWGSSFLFIKIGLEEGLTPFWLVSARLWIATIFLTVVLRLTGARLPRDRRTLRALAVLGVINVAVPFGFITWGELYITSALASILNGLVPLFTIVIAALALHDEPITLNRLGGLAIGFAGAVLLISPGFEAGVEPAAAPPFPLAGELAVVLASVSYAFAAVYIRRTVAGKPLVDDPRTGPRSLTPVEIALPQGIIGGVITTTVALLFERPEGGLVALPASAQAWFAVTWLAVLGSGVAYLLFFRIIRAWGATRTTLVTYVMPVVGIALGVIVLQERLHLAEILGGALVIGGLVLANSSIGQRRLYGRAGAGSSGAPTTAPTTPGALHE